MTTPPTSPLDKELNPPAHLAPILQKVEALYRDEVAPREQALAARLADESLYLDADGKLHPEIIAARREIMRAAGKLGVYSAHLPTSLGGGGLGRTDMIYVEEKVYGYGCGLNPALLSWSEGATPRLLAHALHSQVDMHQAYGGVVPDLASRKHLQHFPPLLQRALPVAIKAAKSMGFKVALHTAGAAPIRLESIVRDLDWVGFDLKAQFSRYGALTGAPRGGQNARRSLAILAASGVSFEVRTTAWPGFHDPDDVAELARCAKAARAGAFVIQQARDPVSRRPVASPFFSDPSTVAGLRGEFPFLTLRPA